MNSQSNGLFWEEIFGGKHASLKSRFFDFSRKIDWRLFEEPLKAGLSRAKRCPSKGGSASVPRIAHVPDCCVAAFLPAFGR